MVSVDNKFSQVPQWVLDADISDGAFRLYAALMRYADYQDGTCYPSRSKLAERIRKSERSIDTYLKELARVGAVVVTHRYLDPEKKQQTSSRYTIITADPSFVAPPREEIFAPPGEAHFAPPGAEDCALTIPTLTDTQLNEPRGAADAAPGNAVEGVVEEEPKPWATIAKRAYDGTQGALPFMGMQTIAKWAIEKKGADPGDVERAIGGLYKSGQAVTKQTVGQVLDGIRGTRKPGEYKPGWEKRFEHNMSRFQERKQAEIAPDSAESLFRLER